MTKKRLVLGIDFDGTIVEEAFPNIGAIKPKTVELMQEAMDKGHLVIVWTARSMKAESDAIDFLNDNNIPYHYVNENPEDPYYIRGEQGRKIFCDYYLDDRAVNIKDIDKLFEVIKMEEIVKARLLANITLLEAGCEDEAKTFKKDSIVEVVREVRSENGYKQYLIYSEELNDSTVIYSELLDFKYLIEF
jgi:hydroxymethylpyrimidine pyrophosphatase-like HAD family hydrolase